MPSAEAQPGQIQIQFQPTGKRVNVPAGSSLLQTARSAGIELTSDCGGEGSCGQCQVVILSGAKSGAVSEPAENEGLSLSPLDLINGRRLACSTTVLGDLVVEIPRELVISGQRLQVESQLHEITPEEVDPPVRAVRLELPRPSLADSRADFTRLTDALGEQGFAAQELHAHPSVLRSLPEILREEAWRLTAYVRGDEIVGFGPVEERALGLCVDLGTTKIAASLVDLATGRSLGSTGAPNPQMGYGEDVISRINHLLRHPETAQILAEKVQKTLNDLLGELLAQASERQAVEQQTSLGQQPPSLSQQGITGLQSSLSQHSPEGQVSSLGQPPEARPIQPAQPNLPRPLGPAARTGGRGLHRRQHRHDPPAAAPARAPAGERSLRRRGLGSAGGARWRAGPGDGARRLRLHPAERGRLCGCGPRGHDPGLRSGPGQPAGAGD